MPLFSSGHLLVQCQHQNELTIMELKNFESIFFYDKILNYQSRLKLLELLELLI